MTLQVFNVINKFVLQDLKLFVYTQTIESQRNGRMNRKEIKKANERQLSQLLGLSLCCILLSLSLWYALFASVHLTHHRTSQEESVEKSIETEAKCYIIFYCHSREAFFFSVQLWNNVVVLASIFFSSLFEHRFDAIFLHRLQLYTLSIFHSITLFLYRRQRRQCSKSKWYLRVKGILFFLFDFGLAATFDAFWIISIASNKSHNRKYVTIIRINATRLDRHLYPCHLKWDCHLQLVSKCPVFYVSSNSCRHVRTYTSAHLLGNVNCFQSLSTKGISHLVVAIEFIISISTVRLSIDCRLCLWKQLKTQQDILHVVDLRLNFATDANRFCANLFSLSAFVFLWNKWKRKCIVFFRDIWLWKLYVRVIVFACSSVRTSYVLCSVARWKIYFLDTYVDFVFLAVFSASFFHWIFHTFKW